MECMVSIIMPAYNAAKTIEKSVESVLAQTFGQWELIIINDCSTDSTIQIIKKYQSLDSRILLLNQEKNQGVARARNKGILAAKGKYIAFLDSDDYWTENKLKTQIEFMENGNVLFSYSDMYVVNSDNDLIGKRIAPAELGYKDLLKSNHIGCLTVIVDKKIMENHLMKDVGHEDYLTWLRILQEGIRAYNCNEALAYYRVSENSLSSNKIKAAIWQWNIYRKELGLNVFKSGYYFFCYVINGIKKHFGLVKR